MLLNVRISTGVLVFLTGLCFALSDLATDAGFGDAFAWIFSAVAALIFIAWFFENPEWTLAVSGLFGALALICGVTSIFAHSPAARPSVEKAYMDLFEISVYCVGGGYGNEFLPEKQKMFSRMMEDCGLQGAQNDLNLAEQLNETQALGPTMSILARSAGALTPLNPQNCQVDYEQMRNAAPELFSPYQKDLVSLNIRPKFWAW